VVVVADHVNLTWLSPLTGPNDERIGPRFPVMSGLYHPEGWSSRGGRGGGVGRDGRGAGDCATGRGRGQGRSALGLFESAVVRWHGIRVVSSELVPVAILAAHMGFRLAAVVLLDDECTVAPGAADMAVALMGPERRG